jgi:hypothetical protein
MNNSQTNLHNNFLLIPFRDRSDNRGCVVHCPATIANLVCGFDILGLALETPMI